MNLSEQHKRLLHVAVRRYDPQTGSAYLDPVAIEAETGVELTALAQVIDDLEEGGYLERVQNAEGEEPGEGWLVRPTDQGLLTAMGLA